MVRNVPMVHVVKPEPGPPLSAQYAGVEWLSHSANPATYKPIRLRRPPACDECFALQHETGGAFGTRAPAKHRRTLRNGRLMDLCNRHANAWRERDDREKTNR
jgi:hypothetical protein